MAKKNIPGVGSNPLINPQAFSNVVGVELAGNKGRFGVIGINVDDNAFGFLAGEDLVFHQHAGVYGQSDQQGVMGIGTAVNATGVFGGHNGGKGFGVRGETKDGIAVQGQNFGTGLAGKFIGDVQLTGKILGPDPQRVDILGQLEGRISRLEELLQDTQPKVPVIEVGTLSIRGGEGPNFTAIYDGPPIQAQFTVVVTDGGTFRFQADLAVENNGHGEVPVTINLPGKRRLYWAATKGTPSNSDLTGQLWTNTVTTP